MDKLLIIGSDGFVGRSFSKEFSNHFDVFGVGLKTSSNLRQYYQCDIEKKTEIKNIIASIRPQFVINLAANIANTIDYNEYDDSYGPNVIGLKNIFEAVIEEEISLKQFIFFSSCEVYGKFENIANEEYKINPVTIYSLTKAIGENIANYFASVYNIPITIVRPSLIYGEEQKGRFFLYNMVKNLLVGLPFDTTYGEQTRDFIYISDVYNVCYEILDKKLFLNDTVNLTYGESFTLKEIVEFTAEYTKSSSIINFGAIPYRESEIMNYRISNQKLKEMVSSFPKIHITEGIKKIVQYFETNMESQY